LDLKPGERIADIGAGSGYFTFRFARHVGNTGQVYAVDISPDMILHLNRRIRDLGLGNVRTVLADPDDPLLGDRSVDRVFICETWHHIDKHAQYLTLLEKMLRPGGQVIIVDFQKKETPVGPPMEMRASRGEVVRELEQSGFRLVKEHTFLPYQYYLVFSPGAGPSPSDAGQVPRSFRPSPRSSRFSGTDRLGHTSRSMTGPCGPVGWRQKCPS